jgi:hypothetical protein
MSSSQATEKPTSNESPAPEQKKPTAALEEDDEFEDFPAEGS